MQTYPTSAAERPGFTFIEVVIVIALLAVVMTLTVPAFQAVLERDRDREINRITSVLSMARSEAILSRRSFRLQIDLTQGAYWVEAPDGEGKYAPMESIAIFRRHEISKSLELRDIMVYGSKDGRQAGKIVAIVIDSSGFVDPFLLHFTEGREDWTLRVSGFSGKSELVEGYSDELLP